jgi:hypothetical protein
MRVHEALGPGLLESVYRLCMILELQASGYHLDTTTQSLVELKAAEKLLPVHKTQVLTYLKRTGLPVGRLMNFHVDWLKNGTRRIVP